MSGPRYRRGDAMVEVLQDWGGWVRTGREAVGWGGVQAQEGGPMPKAPGSHSDPLYREYLTTTGEGLYRMIDARLKEHHDSYRAVIRMRYAGMLGFAEIGRKLKIEADICRIMHDRSVSLLRIDVVRYMVTTGDREAEATYGRRLAEMA